MEKRKLYICDEDETYARKLYEYISSRSADIYDSKLFTSKEILLESLGDENPNVLLVSGTFQDTDWSSYRIEHIVCLTESRNELSDKPAIFKYSPANVILNELMSLYTVTEAVTFDIGTGTKIIGIYSPVKRRFQTSFAIALGQVLAKEKKALYLNFESFSGFDILTGKATKTDLMDVLYLSECDKETFSYRIGSLTEKFGKLEYIPPTRVYTAFAEISAKQWQSLINLISEQTDYEILLLDLSEHVIGLLDILNRCDRIYTIVDNGRTAQAKIAQYQSFLQETSRESVLAKTKNISIPEFKEIPAEFELLGHSELAAYVRNLLEQEKKDGKGLFV